MMSFGKIRDLVVSGKLVWLAHILSLSSFSPFNAVTTRWEWNNEASLHSWQLREEVHSANTTLLYKTRILYKFYSNTYEIVISIFFGGGVNIELKRGYAENDGDNIRKNQNMWQYSVLWWSSLEEFKSIGTNIQNFFILHSFFFAFYGIFLLFRLSKYKRKEENIKKTFPFSSVLVFNIAATKIFIQNIHPVRLRLCFLLSFMQWYSRWA